MVCNHPEGNLPAELHYDEYESERYHNNSRIMKIQTEMATRCLELLEMELLVEQNIEPLILDIGCGSGISGKVLTDNEIQWLGVDISESMLNLAQSESVIDTGSYLDLCCHDIGAVAPFRPGIFDGAISVSTIQWLCSSYHKDHNPKERLRTFFSWLKYCLKSGARAVLQFYPESQEQTDLIGSTAASVGFFTYFLEDNSESIKKRKIYLIVSDASFTDPNSALTVALSQNHARALRSKGIENGKHNHREKILKHKEKMRQRGHDVARDSKYTGRKRKDRF